MRARRPCFGVRLLLFRALDLVMCAACVLWCFDQYRFGLESVDFVPDLATPAGGTVLSGAQL